MTNARSIDILFNVESEAQFESIRPLLEYLRDQSKITFDIIVPNAVSENISQNKDTYDACAKLVRKNKFEIIRTADGVILPEVVLGTKYKIYLSAYIYKWQYDHLNVNYRIMYPYASYYLNKPDWTIEQFIRQDYMADALLSHAVGTKMVTDIFTTTYIVPSLKLMNVRKHTNDRVKPVVFFAPTYSEVDFSINILKDIQRIKKKYKVIMRGHHKAVNNTRFRDITQILLDEADEVYNADSHSLAESLEAADIVISDNSAVIFDAIYCGVPVALFGRDPNSAKYRDINTAQAELVLNGDVLWTDDSNELLDIIHKTLESNTAKQQELKKRLFPDADSTNAVSEWMHVLEIYLNDNVPKEYSYAKRYWVENIERSREDNLNLSAEVAELKTMLACDDAGVAKKNESRTTAVIRRPPLKALLHKIRIKKGQYAKKNRKS